jgi:hypothetical protein
MSSKDLPLVKGGPNLLSASSGCRKEAGGGAFDGAEKGNQADGAQVQTIKQKQKGVMLDELCALTGWSRRHARRALTEALAPAGSKVKPRVRPPVYGHEVMAPLKLIWATFDGPCGKRLVPFIAEIVEVLERCGELSITDEQRSALLSISASHSADSDNRPMALTFLYVIVGRKLRLLFGRLRSDARKDVEIAVLRHELAIMRRRRRGNGRHALSSREN